MQDIKNRKKKKRSFMQQMKRMNRKGSQRRGDTLSQEEYNHYMMSFECLKTIEKDEKGTLVKSLLSQMVKGKNLKTLASHKLVSRILDEILPEATLKDLFPVMEVFSEDLRPLCVDPFASHVLQTLLTIAFRNIQEGATEKIEDPDEEPVIIDEHSTEIFNSFLLKVSKFVYNNLEDFIKDVYASYVVRTTLEICSGVTVSDSVKCSRKSQTFHLLKKDAQQGLEVPENLTSVWHQILERIEHLPMFEVLLLNDCGSATLQTALLTLAGRDEKEKERLVSLASHIIEHGFMKLEEKNEEIHKFFTIQSTCRLMEVLVSVLPEENQELIYRAYFQDQMIKLVHHEVGHHAVEKLFSSWKSKDTFSSMLSAQSDCLNEAFQHGRFKILHLAVQSCRRLNSYQSRMEKILMKMLECYDPEDLHSRFAILLLYMIKCSDYEERKNEGSGLSCNAFGSYIIEELLHFKKPIKIVNSILEMSSSELLDMARDIRGSHIIDFFISGPSVGEKSKIQLYKKLKGHYVALACNKHGSFSLEHIWSFLNVKLKTELSKELYDARNQLQDNPFGVIIYNKFQLKYFAESGEKNWQELQENALNKKLLLKRMLEETSDQCSISAPTTKKKKKKLE